MTLSYRSASGRTKADEGVRHVETSNDGRGCAELPHRSGGAGTAADRGRGAGALIVRGSGSRPRRFSASARSGRAAGSAGVAAAPAGARAAAAVAESDRKSTRLNSSHVEISYAVFCLKKKK